PAGEDEPAPPSTGPGGAQPAGPRPNQLVPSVQPLSVPAGQTAPPEGPGQRSRRRRRRRGRRGGQPAAVVMSGLPGSSHGTSAPPPPSPPAPPAGPASPDTAGVYSEAPPAPSTAPGGKAEASRSREGQAAASYSAAFP